MCSREIDAQLDASLDEKLMEFRPGVHDTSVLLYAVQVSMTWLADAVSAKNIRNPGEHVFGAFNAITKIANGFILNIRAAEGQQNASPPASNAHDCGNIVILIAKGIYSTQHSRLLVSAYSAMKSVLKAMTISSVWPLRVLQRECESFLVSCTCGQTGVVLPPPLKEFAAHCGLESNIPSSNSNSVSLCMMVLSAVIEVSSIKDHTSPEFPRALAELISLTLNEPKYEVAVLSIIKANLSAGFFDYQGCDATVRRLLALPLNQSDSVVMALHASCLDSFAYHLQNSKLLSKSPLNSYPFDFQVLKEEHLLTKMLTESPVSLRANFLFLAASADFNVFDTVESAISAITSALQLVTPDQFDLLPFYFGQSPKLNGMSIISPSVPVPSLILQSLIDFTSHFMKHSHVNQDFDIGLKRRMDTGLNVSIADSFLEAVSAKILELCQVVDLEPFRVSYQWLVSIWTFTYILETYSLDWASSHANQLKLKAFLSAITTVLRLGELTKGSTSEQLLTCSVACSLMRMCKAAGLRTTISKDCILILNCIFEALNKGCVSADSNFCIAFEICAFYEILCRGSFHDLANSYVFSCKHALFLSFCTTCSVWNFTDLLLLLEQRCHSPLILYLAVNMFSPQLLSFSNSTFDAILSFFPIHLRDYFSFKIKSQAAYISEVSVCITKQHALQCLSVVRRLISGFQNVSDAFSSAVVLCCCASLKFLNSPDPQNEQAIGEFLSFFGEFSVRNLTVGLSFCSLLPELIAIISCYKYGPYCTVMGCLPSGDQSSLALPTLKSDFTCYSQKFLQIIITKAEKNSQVSEEASQISFTMDEVKSIIATLTLLLCSMGLDDQLGNESLKTIITFLSDPDFTSLDSFSAEPKDDAIESNVLWSLHTVANAHEMEISQLVDMHKKELYPIIADSMCLIIFMTERVYKCSKEQLIIRMLPVLVFRVLRDTPKISFDSGTGYSAEIPMPDLLKRMLVLMGKVADGERDERKMSEELFQAITLSLPQIMSWISFSPDAENSPSISKLLCLLRKQKPQDLLKDARAVLYSSCEYLGEALPCDVKLGQDCIQKICCQLLELKAQPTSGKRGGRASQTMKMATWDQGRNYFYDEMSKYILPRYIALLKQTDSLLQASNLARSLQRSIPILHSHAVSLAPKISSLISNTPLIPSSLKVDILETLIFEVVSSGSSSNSRVCAVGDWVNLRSPIENGRPASDPVWKGPYRVASCNMTSGSLTCCIEDTILDVKMTLPADDLMPIDISILKTIPILIAELGSLHEAEPSNVSTLLTAILNTDSFRSFLFLLPYGLDIPGFMHIDNHLHALFDRCTLKGNLYRCLPGVQSENDRVRQLSIIELRRVLGNGKLPQLVDSDFVGIFQCCIATLLHRAHVGAPQTKVSCGHCIGELGALDPQNILHNLSPKKTITLPDLAQDMLMRVYKLTIGGKAMQIAEYVCLDLLLFLGCKDLELDKNNQVVGSGGDLENVSLAEKFWNALPNEMKKSFKQFLATSSKCNFPVQQELTKSSKQIFRSGISMKQWTFGFVKELMIRVSSIHNGKLIMLPCLQVLRYSYELQVSILPKLLAFLVENGQDDDRDMVYKEIMAILSMGSCDVAEVDASVMTAHSSCDQSILQEVFLLMDHLSSITMHRKYATENRLTKFLERFPAFTMASRSLGISDFSAALMFAERSWREQSETETKLRDPILKIMQRSLSSLEAVDDIPALLNLMRTKAIDDIAFHYESLGNWTAALPCFERGNHAMQARTLSDSMDTDDELYSSLCTESFAAESFDSSTLTSASIDLRHSVSRVYGLLNCLKQIGSFECAVSAAIHAAAVYPQFASTFRARAIQCAWRQGPSGFPDIKNLLKSPIDEDFDVAIGHALVALAESEFQSVEHWVAKARDVIMDPLAATSSDSYRRSYPHIIKLHMLKDFETAVFALQSAGNGTSRRECMQNLLNVTWKKRLMRTQSSLRLREPILSLHRCLVEIAGCGSLVVDCWLNVARSARKSGNLEAGHAAIIHAKRSAAGFVEMSDIDKAFILYEDAKLKWTSGQKHLALDELQNALKSFDIFPQHRDPRPERVLAQFSGEKSRMLPLVWRFFDWSYDIGEDLPAVQLELARPWLEKFGEKHEKSQLLLARYFDKVYMWAKDIIGMKDKEKKKDDSARTGALVGLQSDLSDSVEFVVYTNLIDSRKIVDSATPGYQYSNPQKSTSYDANKQPIVDTMKVHACRLLKFAMGHYINALRLRGVNVFEEISRVLSLYFHLNRDEDLSKACNEPPQDKHGSILLADVDALLHKALLELPTWQWLCALPQLLSRLEHDIGIKFQKAKFHVRDAIAAVLCQYPERAFWRFSMIMTSTSDCIRRHCSDIVSRARYRARLAGADREPYFINCLKNAENVLKHLQQLSSAGRHCNDQQKGKDYRLDDELIRLGHLSSSQFSHLVVPCQDALSPSLSCIESGPDDAIFSFDVPKIKSIDRAITVMSSKQAPVKVALISSDGKKVHFLLKPMSRSSPDDYRKDAYMMDFCALLNRLFERSSDGRSRELSLRTYAVIIVTQNIGMMEWVNDSQTLRSIMIKLYDEHRATIDPRLPSHQVMGSELAKMQKPLFHKPSQESLKILKDQYCSYFDGIPVLLYKWFLQTYQSPNEWFNARLKFVRSMAVWSIVGYITGLGDRHAENILMHLKSGSCFHVDFECLLGNGSSLNVPERVPFRLTPNLVDAMGPSGEEGAFRTCCIVTMKVLREHRTGLFSVSETFTNDPLIKWNDNDQELRKENLKCRLAGVMIKGSQPLSESGQVQSLIQEAKDISNLCRMFCGWSPWYEKPSFLHIFHPVRNLIDGRM